MSEVLRDVFMCLIYLAGIGVTSLCVAFIFTLLVALVRKSDQDKKD